MKKISLFLKYVKELLVVNIWQKLVSGLRPNDPARLSALADQKLLLNLGKKKWPSLAQLKALPQFLNAREKRIIRLSVGLIAVCLITLLVNFYFSHTAMVAKQGGSYTEGLVGTPQYINPILASYNDVDRDLSSLIFNGLLKLNDEGVLVPDLAEDYQISPDKKSYTFNLKQNVVWHDNAPLTADDIIFTVTSIQDPEWQSQLKSALGNVQVEKISDFSVRFILKEPVAGFAGSLTFGILPEHLWQSIPSSNAVLAELNKKPIGTGPFKFKAFTKDKNGNIRTLTLERNDQYYAQPAFIDELRFKFYGDFDSASAALADNHVEGLGLLPKEFQERVAKNKNLNYYSLSLPQYTAVFFNTKQTEALKSKEVRQALAYAIDRQQILRESIDQKGTIINGPILPGFIGYHPDVKKYPQNIDEAQKLLDQAGWKVGDNGLRKKGDNALQLTLTTVDKAEYIKAAEIIKKNWEALGVSASVDVVTKERIRPDIIEPRAYQALLFGQIIKTDPFSFWHSGEAQSPGANLAVWASRDVDKILAEARGLDDLAMVNKKYVEFQNILAENVPAIFLYNPIQTYPVDQKIKGLTTRRISTPADRFNKITDWYIKTKREFSWKKK